MASIFTLFLAVVVAWIGFGNASSEFVSVQCNPKYTGQFGHQSLLDCVIKTSEEVTDPKIRIVTWRKVGDEEPLLKFDGENVLPREGYKFAEPSWNDKNLNVSLLITNTEIQHEGEYKCMVYTDSGTDTKHTTLSVTATYNKPTITPDPKNFQHGQDLTLTCDTEGGYPQGDLRWYDNVKTDWTKSAELQATPGPDGRFQLSSTLRLKSGSIFSTYTCVVFNASGGKEEEVMFDLEKSITDQQVSGTGPSVNPSKWVAPLVVIGSLIVGLLVVLLLYLRRRSRQLRRNSAAPLMGEHVAVPIGDADGSTCDVEKGGRA